MAAHAYIPSAFQFHYGSIRTAARIKELQGDVHFNSIMVQLEQQIETKVPEFSSGFNSIKVQLEQRYPEYDFEHSVQFQFHQVQLEHLRVDTVFVLMRNPQVSHMLNFPLHIETSYPLLTRSTNSSGVSISIFEKPNHFLPKSLMDAPM